VRLVQVFLRFLNQLGKLVSLVSRPVAFLLDPLETVNLVVHLHLNLVDSLCGADELLVSQVLEVIVQLELSLGLFLKKLELFKHALVLLHLVI
jgi:hypothetical protein